jgi:hypothetical protein
LDSTRRRMIAVAVAVCGFAVGMAGLLNFFKYRATANRVVTERLVVTGKAVENTIQGALSLGLQFSEIGTLQATLDRERANDLLIVGMDVFDTDGKPMYSTDRLRATRPAPQAWMDAAHKAGKNQWNVNDDHESAVGIPLKNNFDVTIGYLAVRYSGDRVREAALVVGRELFLTSFAVFVVSALFASAAVAWVTRDLLRDMSAVEGALRQAADGSGATANSQAKRTERRAGAQQAAPSVPEAEPIQPHLATPNNINLAKALQRFLRATQSAERRLVATRASLNQGSSL